MRIKLTVDEGNSATKLGLWHDNCEVAEANCRHATMADVEHALDDFGPVDSAIMCSVLTRNTGLAEVIRRRCPSMIELSYATPMPVTIGYRTPETLGRDRIAGAVGAHHLHPGEWLLVVDMGTAITYDVVDPSGLFTCGNIAPGIFMRLQALRHYTSALPAVETDGDVPRWGYDTVTAMRSGAIRGVLGELQYYRHGLPAGSRVILTGGSAELIIPLLGNARYTFEPNLVHLGLNCIINYNENL